MACVLSCGFGYPLDCILYRLECLIQVCSWVTVYWIVLFDMDIIDYHTRRVRHQLHQNQLGDECHSPSSSQILPTSRHDVKAFWRQLHTLQNNPVFCSATSEALMSTWEYSRSTWDAHRVLLNLCRIFWELLEWSVQLTRIAESSSYDFSTISHCTDVLGGGWSGNGRSGLRHDGSQDSICCVSCHCRNVESSMQLGPARGVRPAGSGRRLPWDDTVPSVCSTRCLQYLVYA